MIDIRPSIRLKISRIAAGYPSAKEFCEKFNIPTSTYSLHETGGRRIKESAAKKYATYLKINSEWILSGIGAPFQETDKNIAHKDSLPLSHEEFLALLQYTGNEKIPNNNQLEKLNNVNPLLLGKIFTSLYEVIKKIELALDDYQFTRKATEIYQDIISSSEKIDEQLSMVNLSISIFKRQIEAQREQYIRKTINK